MRISFVLALTAEMLFPVSAALIVVLLIVLLAAFLSSRRDLRKANAMLALLVSQLDGAELLEDELPADGLERIFEDAPSEGLRAFSKEMGLTSRSLYAGVWLSDPVPKLMTIDRCFDMSASLNRIRFAGWLCLSIGLISGTVIAAVMLWFQFGNATLIASLPPVIVGIVLALFLTKYWKNTIAARYKVLIERASSEITCFAPVFQERNGLAAMISEVMRYGEAMRQEVQTFGILANKLAEGDFAEGIRTSVREVMMKEVVPPLQTAVQDMQSLAVSLSEKQDRGMEALARAFADEASEALANHMQQLNDGLKAIQTIVEKTSLLVDESMRSVEDSAERNEAIHKDVREAVRVMALAKNDIADEMVSLSDNLKIIGASTDRMTALYAGEETDLAKHIHHMAEQLRLYTETLDQGITENARVFSACCDFSSTQTRDAATIQQELSSQIKVLEKLSAAIESNTTNFTQESSDYVIKTLEQFDSSLAEVVERLTFTAAEIRDAVDALPPAIRRVAGGRDSGNA
jgi:hypothetical protein